MESLKINLQIEEQKNTFPTDWARHRDSPHSLPSPDSHFNLEKNYRGVFHRREYLYTLTGKVIGIADGDTITVLGAVWQQHKVRLVGIDAPEKVQPFGQRSKQNLSSSQLKM